MTREHVPPRQFYPKSLRQGRNLWTIWTCASCNASSKLDEEYFFHCFYPLVAKTRPSISQALGAELRRRVKHSQSQSLLRELLATKRSVTSDGIHLPPGIYSLEIDLFRAQQVAIKIARCLHFRDYRVVMAPERCLDIRLCERETDVPERYRISWDCAKVPISDLRVSPGGVVLPPSGHDGKAQAVLPEVFDYRSCHIEALDLYLYTLQFWESFMFCLTFGSVESARQHSAAG